LERVKLGRLIFYSDARIGDAEFYSLRVTDIPHLDAFVIT